ncbi:MAG: hypothetical protein LBQ38_04210 [Spirochaetaceae bacterium]|jgi:hypothetical protein|nr:hypothetical protein [Spirochaetaceae bacterium]
MKKNANALSRVFSWLQAFFGFLKLPEPRLGPVLAASAAFLLSLGVIITGRGYSGLGVGDIGDFEVDRVAERDVFADKSVSYTDWEATRRRIAERERMVPAVFTYSDAADEAIRGGYGRFAALGAALFAENAPLGSFRSAVARNFPPSFHGRPYRPCLTTANGK